MNDLNVNRQLLEDLCGMEEQFIKRGWTPGALIRWTKNLFRGGDHKPTKEEALGAVGSMCVTGAAGVVAEGVEFIMHAASTGTSNATNWSWSPRGRRLLACLVANMPTTLTNDMSYAASRVQGRHMHMSDEERNDWVATQSTIEDLISAIIDRNDNHLLQLGEVNVKKTSVLQWVRTAKSYVEHQIELQEQQAELQEVAAEPPMEFPALKRKVEYIKAGQTAPPVVKAKQQELA